MGLRAPQLFDGTNFVGPATVLVRDGLLVGVEAGHPDLPDGTPVTTYDGTLLPGLFDTHVHLIADSSPGSLERAGVASDAELDDRIRASLTSQVRAGVTTVQDLGDRNFRTLAARTLPGLPRVLAAGPPITEPGGHCHFLGGEASGVDGVRVAVEEHVERGVDVIKVMGSGGMLTMGTDVLGVQFSPDELDSAVEAAHQAGLRVLVHAHSVAGIRQAIAAGVDGLEHFTCLDEQGMHLPEDLLDAVATSGLVVCPTLGFDEDRLPPPELMPPNLREMVLRFGLDFPTMRATQSTHLARLRDAGVSVVSGTDAGAALPKPHGTAWRHVRDLVAADFPIAEALASATSGAAAVCGLGDVTGCVRAGLSADLLAVDGDLAEDPCVLGRPVEVWVRGVPRADA